MYLHTGDVYIARSSFNPAGCGVLPGFLVRVKGGYD